MEKKTHSQIMGGSIILKCKDFRILQLDINSSDDLHNVAQSLEKLLSLGNYPLFYYIHI